MDNYNNYNNYNYNDYSSPYENKHEPKKKSAFAGFGVTLIKTVTIALVFGLVAGVACSAVIKFNGTFLGIFSGVEIEEDAPENESDASTDRIPEGGLQQTDTNVQANIAVMDVSDVVKNVKSFFRGIFKR